MICQYHLANYTYPFQQIRRVFPQDELAVDPINTVIHHGGNNKQRQGSPSGLSNTYPPENRRRTRNRRPNQTTSIGQWERSVYFVEPRRRPTQTPHADNYKRGISGIDGFHNFSAAQSGQLLANHGKLPRTSAMN